MVEHAPHAGVQTDAGVLVGVLDGIELGLDFNMDAEFLEALPAGGVGGGLVGLEFSTWEFPISRVERVRKTFGNQDMGGGWSAPLRIGAEINRSSDQGRDGDLDGL